MCHGEANVVNGHFAAWEQPKVFSEELRAGFRPLRTLAGRGCYVAFTCDHIARRPVVLTPENRPTETILATTVDTTKGLVDGTVVLSTSACCAWAARAASENGGYVRLPRTRGRVTAAGGPSCWLCPILPCSIGDASANGPSCQAPGTGPPLDSLGGRTPPERPW